MTKAQRTRAERILYRHAEGWRFAVAWPPGFTPQPFKTENRGAHTTTSAGRRWHGDNIERSVRT